MAALAWPRFGRGLVEIAIVVSQVGFCCAYLLFIVSNLEKYYLEVSRKFWLTLMLPAAFMFTLIPDLKTMAWVTFAAQLLQLTAFMVVIDFDFDHLHLIEFKNRKETDFNQLPFFTAIAVYCFEVSYFTKFVQSLITLFHFFLQGAGMILTLEHSVPDHYRSSFKSIFVKVIAFVAFLYVFFGVAGYLSYGEATRDVISLNLESHGWINWSVIVKLLLCTALFLTYPLMMFPVIKILRKRLSEVCRCTQDNLVMNLVMRLVLVSITGLTILVIPNFGQIMELIGATVCTQLAFTLPALFHFLLNKNPTYEEKRLDISLIIVGVATFLICTYRAIMDILEDYNKAKEEMEKAAFESHQ